MQFYSRFKGRLDHKSFRDREQVGLLPLSSCPTKEGHRSEVIYSGALGQDGSQGVQSP